MKTQTTKKLFVCLSGRRAFIITVMLFSVLAEFANGQTCNLQHPCPRGYACVNGRCKCSCLGHPVPPACAPACGPVIIVPVPVVYADYISQSAFHLFKLPPQVMSNAKIFDTEGALKTLPGSKKQQSIRQIEWGVTDEALKLPGAL